MSSGAADAKLAQWLAGSSDSESSSESSSDSESGSESEGGSVTSVTSQRAEAGRGASESARRRQRRNHADRANGSTTGGNKAVVADAATATALADALADAPLLHPAASLFAVQRSLHRTKHDLRNRLHSIHYDGGFVSAVTSLFYPAGFACFANLRQGAWYLDPAIRAASGGGTCCFKSSDGHAGQWCFNPRRLNKHVALAAANRGGVVVVDSTRGGKRLPDALSKTVPIWCSVLNTALARHRQRQARPELEPEPEGGDAEREYLPQDRDINWDCALCVAPMIPPSEAAQIADRIEGWVDDLEASGSGGSIDLQQLSESLRKPLRPLWLYADNGLSTIPTGYAETLLRSVPSHQKGGGADDDACDGHDGDASAGMVDFTPVICLMASETSHPKRGDFVYGQGAADDEEGWSLGLTAAQWWQHQPSILAPTSLEGTHAAAAVARSTHLQHQSVGEAAGILAASKLNSNARGIAPGISCTGESSLWSEICDGDGVGLGVAVGCWEAGAAPQVWEQFGSVINCGAPQHPDITAGKATVIATECRNGNAGGSGSETSKSKSPSCDSTDTVIGGDTRYHLWLDIAAGGKQSGAAKTFTRCLPTALEFAERSLAIHNGSQQRQGQKPISSNRAHGTGCGSGEHKGKRLGLLLHCDETEERSVAVAVAVIAHCFTRASHGLSKEARSSRGGLGRLQLAVSDLKIEVPPSMSRNRLEQPKTEGQRDHFNGRSTSDDGNVNSTGTMDKAYLRSLLCRVQEARPGATTPQRALLQVINRHFLSRPPVRHPPRQTQLKAVAPTPTPPA